MGFGNNLQDLIFSIILNSLPRDRCRSSLILQVAGISERSPMLKEILKCLVFLVLSVASLAGWGEARCQATWSPNALSVRYMSFDFYSPVTVGASPLGLKNLAAGLEVGYFRSMRPHLNLGVPMRVGRASFPREQGGFSDFKVFGSLDLIAQGHLFEDDRDIAPFAFAGGGVSAIPETGLSFQVPVGAGVQYRLGDGVQVQLQTEYRIAIVGSTKYWAHSIGLVILLGEPEKQGDMDGDGIRDREDDCPLVPGIALFRGCPDADGDGIPDREDECVDVAGDPAFGGCPDTDGDNIPDRDDDCPREAGPRENNGCPLPDLDQDGIPDQEDDCPDKAGGAEMRGCPDSDGDGVKDELDRCPDIPGPANNQGCPPLKKEEREVLAAATRSVAFESESNRLTQGSYVLLDRIAILMAENPLYHLRISGHTDSEGASSFNKVLSERRAIACFDYLVSRGVDPTRLSAYGYGEERPIADNRFPEGRARNRRVVFEMYIP